MNKKNKTLYLLCNIFLKQVTTINGARIAPNKRDIEIPQGIAHAVDRVMFPLPVGDLMQTLAADREQRFGIFLRILQAAGLEEILTGIFYLKFYVLLNHFI